MGRKQRKRGRTTGQRKAKRAAKTAGGAAVKRGDRKALVPWRERARQVLRELREYARDREGAAIEAHLRDRLGDAAAQADVAELQRAFDDYVCAPGSAGDGRSLVRAFTEETTALEAAEKGLLPTWEADRARRVYLLDRCHRDRMELWDPVAGGRVTLHLLERLSPARAAAMRRGTVVIAISVPWGRRQIALGQVELYEEDDAIDLYRREVRQGGRTWHELPAATPGS